MQVRGGYNSEKTLANRSVDEMNQSWAKIKNAKIKTNPLNHLSLCSLLQCSGK